MSFRQEHVCSACGKTWGACIPTETHAGVDPLVVDIPRTLAEWAAGMDRTANNLEREFPGATEIVAGNRELARKLRAVDAGFTLLLREVLAYLEKPGCNAPAKVTAMHRLTWAREEAERRAR